LSENGGIHALVSGVSVFTVYQSNRLDILKDLLVVMASLLNADRAGMSSSTWTNICQIKEAGSGNCIPAAIPSDEASSSCSHCAMPGLCTSICSSANGSVSGSRHHLDKPTFASLKNYLSDDTTGLRRYQLADRIADIFDQYLVYRPEWISAWERQDDLDIGKRVGEWFATNQLYQQILEDIQPVGLVDGEHRNSGDEGVNSAIF
jgi:exodeoxyribonuclease V gamma subunit